MRRSTAPVKPPPSPRREAPAVLPSGWSRKWCPAREPLLPRPRDQNDDLEAPARAAAVVRARVGRPLLELLRPPRPAAGRAHAALRCVFCRVSRRAGAAQEREIGVNRPPSRGPRTVTARDGRVLNALPAVDAVSAARRETAARLGAPPRRASAARRAPQNPITGRGSHDPPSAISQSPGLWEVHVPSGSGAKTQPTAAPRCWRGSSGASNERGQAAPPARPRGAAERLASWGRAAPRDPRRLRGAPGAHGAREQLRLTATAPLAPRRGSTSTPPAVALPEKN